MAPLTHVGGWSILPVSVSRLDERGKGAYNAMAFIPVPNAAQAVIEYATEAVPWTNTLWFTKTDFDTADLTALAARLDLWVAAEVLPNMSNLTSYNHVKVYDMRADDGEVRQETFSAGPGSDASPPGAMSAAMVVTFYTGGRGRNSRGRNYLTGFSENDMDADQYAESVLVAPIGVAYTNLITTVQLDGWTWVVASRYDNGQPRAAGVTRPVTTVAIRSPKFGSQRRRIARA